MDLDTTGLTPLDAAPAVSAQPQALDVSGLTPLDEVHPTDPILPITAENWRGTPQRVADWWHNTPSFTEQMHLLDEQTGEGIKSGNPKLSTGLKERGELLSGFAAPGAMDRAAALPSGVANSGVENFLREADAVDARLRGASSRAEIDEFIRAKEAERAAAQPAPDAQQRLLPPPGAPPEVPGAAPVAPAAPQKPVAGVPLADQLRERLGLTGEPPIEEPAPEPPQAAGAPTSEAPGLEGDYRTSEGKIIRVRKAPDNQYTIATDTTESRPGTDAFVNRILASEKAEPVKPPSTQMVPEVTPEPVDSPQPPPTTPEKYQQEAPENPFVMARNGDLTADSARDVADKLKTRQQEIENNIFGGKEVADQWRKLHRQSDSAWNSANDAKAREYDAKLTDLENKANLTESDQAFLNGEGWPEHSDPDAWKELSRDLRDVEGDREDAVTTLGYTLRRLPDADKALSETDHRTFAVIQHAMDEESKRGGDPEAFLRDAFTKSAERYGGGPDAQEIVTDDIARLKGLMGNRPALSPAPVPDSSVPAVAEPAALPAPRAAPKAKAPLSIAQFIARNGGLELSDETKGRDYDKVFVPGGGPLARKSGLSIDGFWRQKLIENGYLPYDSDGYASRDIRSELDDALHQDISATKGLGGDRFYSENDRGRIPQKPAETSDIESAAKQILDAHEKDGISRDQIDTKSLYDAAELLVSGEEKDPINALERAYLQEHHNEAELGYARQAGTQVASAGEQGIGPRPQESPIGGGEDWAGFSESGKEPTEIGAEGFSQPRQASLEEFKAHIAQLKAARDAFKSEIQQAMDTNGRYKMDVNYGNGQNSLLLTKNIGELPYRVTRFDGKEPTGHFEVRNLDEAAQEMIGSRKKPPQSTDPGVEGKPQLVIPGAEKIGQGELAQRAANAPLKPKVAQKPADEGLFGDAHKQKDLFGEGAPSPSTMTELGPFEHDKNAPLGQQAQKYTLDRGKATGLEHIVAFDANGNVVAHGSGTANNTGMTPAFQNALMDPKNQIVVHHNHPSNTSLSGVDITTLTAPGLKSVWAHGSGGSVYRGELTDKAAAAFGKFAGGQDLEDGYRRLYILNNAAGDKTLRVLQSAVNAKKITAAEANAVDRHLVNLVLRDAGILDYQTNVDASGIIQRLNLQPTIDAAAKAAAKDAFDGHEKLISDSLANGRRAWGVRHQGDLGAAFGPSGEPTRVNTQAGNAQARPQDDSQKVGQLGLPGIGGVRGRPVSEQLRLLEENPDYKAPPFYSAVENAVQNAKLQKGSLGQWMGYLKNQPGLKPEELDWLNLNTLPQAGLITKAQMAEHVADNKVQPQEVWRGGKPDLREHRMSEVDAGIRELSDWPENPQKASDPAKQSQLDALLKEWDSIQSDATPAPEPTKFGHYMTPSGGENYSELYLTLPQNTAAGNKSAEIAKALREKYGERYLSIAPKDEVRAYYKSIDDYAKAQADATYKVPAAHETGDPAADVNRLAHVFMDDRTVDGGKSLLVKEAQSDMHSQGNKSGYKLPDGEIQQLHNREQELIGKGRNATEAEKQEWADIRNKLQKQGAAVPDAPFKSTWPTLALKHVTKHAVDGGYDSISFVTGDTVADRYDLSKQVDQIAVSPRTDARTGEKTRSVHLFVKGGRLIELGVDANGVVDNSLGIDAKGKPLSDVVGKEVADKIMASDGRQDLTSVDLKVGGAFHRKLYDDIMVREANALGKKYGAKVETKQIDVPGAMKYEGPVAPIYQIDEAIRNAYSVSIAAQLRMIRREILAGSSFQRAVEGHGSIASAQALGGDLVPGTKSQSVHYMKITPSMREAIKTKGLPTFAAGGRVEAANIAQPTPAQAKAGNYAKDHVNVHGLNISIENARGSYRHGVGKDGKPWKSRLPAHYGYIKGTVGADKDHVDCYIGPHIRSPHVYVVDQLNADTKAWDEHKCFIGFQSKFAAINAFHEAFSDGKAGQRFGHVTEMTMDEFKNWLHEGNTKKPIRYKAAA